MKQGGYSSSCNFLNVFTKILYSARISNTPKLVRDSLRFVIKKEFEEEPVGCRYCSGTGIIEKILFDII